MPVLILGGYGTFGKRIAEQLCKHKIPVIIAGRDLNRAKQLADRLGPLAVAKSFDVNTGMDMALGELKPLLVINTCGPFQGADYRIVETCINHHTHYIDLADGRAFVSGFSKLDQRAKQNDVIAICGASSVPGLSSAVIEHFAGQFSQIEELRYGINPGQKIDRGLATTKGILSYVGKPLAAFHSQRSIAYGWQDIYRQPFPQIGRRWMANCEIPDLDILPDRYGIRKVQFSAGLELGVLHLGLWLLSWLVRAGLPINLPAFAKPLLAASNWFNRFGSDTGTMHLILTGKNHEGEKITRSWYLIARDGDGPYIPTIPAVILAKNISQGLLPKTGAYPCVGLISLPQYLDALTNYRIETIIAE